MQTCPTCGSTQNRNNARYCANCGDPLKGAPPGLTGLLVPNIVLQNRYVIARKIGEGGMGAVYQAQDLHLEAKCWAIKEISPALLTDPTERQSAVASFRHEFELLAVLDHVNLPKVADCFEQDGKQYFVMDFVDGQTLEHVVAQTEGFLDETTVLGWAEQLCDVLEYLHTRQPPIVFRDLKPSNIMLTRGGHLKLIDFGIARFFKPGKTKDTAQYGTMGYSAPEQFGTGQTDPRSDLFSLGVTLHYLLTKYDPALTPFNLPPPRTINPLISPEIEAAIIRATKSGVAERFQSVDEMRRALCPGGSDVNQNPRAAWAWGSQHVSSIQVPGAAQVPNRGGQSSAWKWVFGLAVVGLILFLSPWASPGSNTGQPNQSVAGGINTLASATMTTLPTKTTVVTPTPLPDAVTLYAIDLRFGPASGYGLQGTLAAGEALKILGREAGTDWILVAAASGKQGWILTSQVKVNSDLSAFPFVQALGTSTPKPTATAPSGAATLLWLLADDFKDNTNGWLTNSKSYFESGFYHINQTEAGHSYFPTCTNCGPFSDFAYEAMIRKVEGSDDTGYGLMFRGTGDTKLTLYLFDINGKGWWDVAKLTNDGWQQIHKEAWSSAINGGNGRNKLRVICRGSAFEFYANDQLLGQVTDDSYSSGNVGVGVAMAGLHIQVEYVRVWPAN